MVSAIQQQRAQQFLDYHHADEILVLLNSWDIASSKLIAACGYKAIATTSMGVAAALGYPDCEVIQRDEMIEVAKGIATAVDLPVSVDIEAGYGSSIDEVVASVSAFIATGIVGVNIEDSLHLQPQLIDVREFCERISAIRAVAQAQGLHLVINARTDSFYTSNASEKEKLSESIRRGNMYREAGADCVFVQPVWDRDLIATLVKEINAPLNILANPSIGKGMPPSISELQDLGVARVSLGSSLMKATLALIKKVADELSTKGSYSTLVDVMTPLSDANMAYTMTVA